MRVNAVRSEAVAAALSQARLECTGEQIEAAAHFLNLLRQWNRVFNLTGLDEPKTLIERHLVGSLSLRPFLRGGRIADVGSGAGLPGIPLAIAEPARSFALIESRAKRVRFLRHAAGALGLANVCVEHGRAESMARLGAFDTVVARAVAQPAQLLEIVRPLSAPGSRLLLPTARHVAETYDGLAADFALREIVAVDEVLGRSAPRPQPDGAGPRDPRAESVVARLERVA